MKVWDVDRFEEEIPACMVVEWNEYLSWELEQLTKGILGAIPAARQIEGAAGNGQIKLKDPDEIGSFFDSLNKGQDHG